MSKTKNHPAERMVAFDKESQRSIDAQGFMHVRDCNISKAVVNPYFGSEIPKWKEHGLQPTRVYYVLRDPSELAKAAHTFNNLPLLDGHVEVGSSHLDDPEIKQHIVGSTGTDAVFEAPYLKNSLVVWTGDAQDGITSRTQTEISCGYRYDFVPESGVYAGVRYDGRMTNIVGNHVALVETGRAGRDVVVADSQTVTIPEEEAIVKRTITSPGQIVRGALLAYLTPRLATDAAIVPGEITGVMKSVPPGEFSEQVPVLVAAVGDHFKDRLAADASVEGLAAVLHTLPAEFAFDSEESPEDGEDPAGNVDDSAKVCSDCGSKKLAADGKCEDCAAKVAKDEFTSSQVFQLLSRYDIAETDLASIRATFNHLSNPSIAGDQAMTDTKKPEENGTPAPASVTMDAVNEAIQAGVKLAIDAAMPTLRESVKNDMASRYAAAKAVEPFVGTVDPLAADSAESIYKLALDANSVPTEGVEPSSFRAMVGMLKPKADEKRTEAPVALAADAESVKDFHSRYPHAKDIKQS